LRGSEHMPRKPPYRREVCERAVGMVLEHQQEHESQWAASRSIAEKFGMTTETLRRGCAWPRSTAASDRVCRRPRPSGSRTLSVRTVSCVGRTRSSRRRRLSSRGSSTRNRRGDEPVHRRAPVRVRGRADLPRSGSQYQPPPTNPGRFTERRSAGPFLGFLIIRAATMSSSPFTPNDCSYVSHASGS
jgi:hypothetical protein